jgi:cell wall-associated NlpC family hydrolase
MEKIIIISFCLLITICSCQTAARFVDKDEIDKIKQTSTNADDVSSKRIDVPINYDNPTKTIYPKDLSNKYSSKIVSIAKKWIGVPYLYGGNTKAGVDCSGFVKNVYQEVGIDLPRTSAQQYEELKPTNSPVIGDLVFFKKRNKINHVGIFIGDGKMIHSASGKGVIIQSILGTSLEQHLAGYRRAY